MAGDAAGALPGLVAARLWAAARFPYLANGLFGARVVAAPGIGTVAVDRGWRLHADPELVAGWSPALFGGVLVHHVFHLLLEHGQRAAAAEVRADEGALWIRAADAEINDDLVAAQVELPGEPVLPRHLGAATGGLAEHYFARIRGAQDPEKAGRSWELDCGSGADGRARAWDGNPRDALSGLQAELLTRLVAQDVLRHANSAGKTPGGLLRWAQALLEPVLDWRQVLAAELRRAVAETVGAVDYSYRRPSRRASVSGSVVLPSLRRPSPEIAVVCDTSGSMTEPLLATALAETEGLLRSVGTGRRLAVLACDAAAGTARRVSSAAQIELVGGGGTDMAAGIAAAAALRPRPSIVVVLTDGVTPWPDEPPRGIRVVVALLGDRAPAAPGWAVSVRVPSSGY